MFFSLVLNFVLFFIFTTSNTQNSHRCFSIRMLLSSFNEETDHTICIKYPVSSSKRYSTQKPEIEQFAMAKITTTNVDEVAGISEEEEEEFWPTPSLLTGHKIHTIRFGADPAKTLRYKSMSSEELTPLDMTYDNNSGDDDPDEFYDGTGNLMWMAAICFGHLLFQKIEPLRSYLLYGSKDGTTFLEKNKRKFCELGCGTGGAGISLLLSTIDKGIKGSFHVVFSDNDAESLDLCASNCQLNGLDPDSYSQRLLGWGSEHLEKEKEQEGETDGLQPHSFDVVFATDVVYDLKMIAPLFETVDFLLRKADKTHDDQGGHLVLSHVPRFCIPKDGKDSAFCNDSNLDEDSPIEAFLELEHFIETEANKAGLILVETIRPHQVLSEERMQDYDDNDNEAEDSMQQLTLETMEEAHAVTFVFERS